MKMKNIGQERVKVSKGRIAKKFLFTVLWFHKGLRH